MLHEPAGDREDVRNEIEALLQLHIDAGERLGHAIPPLHDRGVPDVEHDENDADQDPHADVHANLRGGDAPRPFDGLWRRELEHRTAPVPWCPEGTDHFSPRARASGWRVVLVGHHVQPRGLYLVSASVAPSTICSRCVRTRLLAHMHVKLVHEGCDQNERRAEDEGVIRVSECCSSLVRETIYGSRPAASAWPASAQDANSSVIGGGRGIRTPETLSGSTVFKTAAINHSAIPPRWALSV